MGELRFEHRMTDADALMWTIEKDPLLRSTITAVLRLDAAPDEKRLRQLLERGTRLVPRMRQRVRGNPYSIAPPRWEVDPHFDLDYHLRWVRAAGDRDLRSVLDLAEPMAMQGFDRARPLWECLVVTDLADGGAALVMKIHHAITDGVGAVQIALVLFELEREADLVELPDAPDAVVMGQLQRFIDAFEHERRRNLGIAKRVPDVAAGAVTSALADPLGTARRLGETAASVARLAAPANVPLSPVMTRRSLSVHFDTVSLPLADAKAAAKRAGGRLNDAFLAATAAGLRRYHEEVGAPVEALRISMPINLRGDDEGERTGNNRARPLRAPRRRDRSGGRHGHHARARGRAARRAGPGDGRSARPRAQPAADVGRDRALRRHAARHRRGREQRARRADRAVHRRRAGRGDVRPRADGGRGGQPHAALVPRHDPHRREPRSGGRRRSGALRGLLPRRLGRGAGRLSRLAARWEPPYPHGR
ncbi:MAG: wax ester/triacylglycerol synthase family O-acyltransferase [Acidimicrobiales bacterium]